MTKKRCLKLMMCYLCSEKREAERWYRQISAMIVPPVRHVDVLFGFHAAAFGIYRENGDRDMALYAALEMVRLHEKYGAEAKQKEM